MLLELFIGVLRGKIQLVGMEIIYLLRLYIDIEVEIIYKGDSVIKKKKKK